MSVSQFMFYCPLFYTHSCTTYYTVMTPGLLLLLNYCLRSLVLHAANRMFPPKRFDNFPPDGVDDH